MANVLTPAGGIFRPPRGGRRERGLDHAPAVIISIHALREEGDKRPDIDRFSVPISIHALREEGDGGLQPGRDRQGISIHALREEGDIPFHLL